MKKKWLLMVIALAMSASMAACNFSFGSESSSESTQSVADSSEAPADSSSKENSSKDSSVGGSSVEDSSIENSSSDDSSSDDSSSDDSSSDDSSSDDSSSDDSSSDGPLVETYLITFVDNNGNVLSSAWLEEGAMPEAPTNVSVPDDTDYVTYTGAWDKEIVAVSGAVTYTWVITESKIMVTVTFNGENATEVAKGETVTAPSIKQAGKIVTGWTLDGETVDLDTYVVTAPVNFEAVWAEVPYATSGDSFINACELPDNQGNWYYEIGTQETVLDWTVALPKLAYEEGKTVTYTWVGGSWILVGINGNYVQGGGVGSEGTISITYADGMLKVTIENTANPATVAGFVSDEEVIAGNKALTISINNGAQYHQFFLSKEYVVTDAPVVPTTLFDGTAVYDSEGAAYTPSNTSDTGAKYSVNQDYGMGTISLPKVDFTTYKQVTMDFATSGWIQFGWGTHLFFYNGASAIEGTITITYRDNLVYMVFESDGVTHPQGWELYFSSTDIHTGNEALTLGYSCLAGTQSITISNFTMTEAPAVETYTITFVNSDGSVLSEQTVEEGQMPEIPTNTTTPENTETMIYTGAWDKEVVAAAGDVTYTWVVTSTEVKPANIFDTTSGYTAAGDAFAPFDTSETGASYSVKDTYGMGTISLPKVDFTTYKQVTMDFATSGWIQFGWGEHLFLYNGGSAVQGTITITYRDNLVYMVFESEGVTHPQGWELYFSSTDIHTGNEALTLGYSCLAGTQSITISNFTMTEAPAVETYTITFVNSDGSVLSEQTVEEGQMPEIPTNTTTPENTETMIYTGAWDKEVVAAAGDVTYTWVVTSTEVKPANIFDTTSGYTAAGDAFAPFDTSETGASYSVKDTYGMGTISLPKVDFTTYKQVTMDFATSGWIQFGWGENLFFYNSGSAVQGTITITYRDNLVYMVFESDGVTHPQGWELYFSSTDIHTGNEALTLGYSCLAGTQSITISNFTMTEAPAVETYTITFVDSDGSVLSEQTVEEGQMPEIPTNTTTPENTETMIYTGAWDKEVVAAAGDVTYTWVVTSTEVEAPVVNSVFAGAKTIFADGTTADAALEENKATFSVANGTNASIAMPCIDYTKYNVTFNWAESNGYVLFGYNQDWYFNAGPAYYGTATLTYASGTLTLVMNSPVEGGGERTYSITAEDIINGTDPLTFTYMGWADGSIVFSDLVMTEVEAPVEPEEPTAPTYTFEGTGVIDGSGNLVKAAEITETGAVYDAPKDLDLYISLPKLDYTKVTKVTFDWQDSGWTKLGSGTAYYSENKADPSVSGSVEIVNNGDGTLTFTFTYGAKVKTETITDADIINGTKAMMMKIKVYGTKPLTISNYTVTYTEISDEPEVPVEVRPSFAGSQTIYADGTTAEAMVGENDVNFSVANGTDASIALPCIDYTKYQVIMFNWSVSNGWIPFSCVNGGWYFNNGVVYYGTATLTYVNGELKVVMNSPVEGGGVREITITDAEILNGQKPLTFYYMGWADGSITLSNMQVYDYAINLAGAQWVDDDGTHDATVSGNNVTYAITNGKDGTVYLPCLDFTKYSVVTFEWIATGGWIPFSCVSGGWYFNSGVVYHGTATLTYANGELKVVMNSPIEGGGVREITITDAEIINGQKAVPFYYLGWGAGSISFSDMRATK